MEYLLKPHVLYEHALKHFSNERICSKPHFQAELKVRMLSEREKASNEIIVRSSMINSSLVPAKVDISDFDGDRISY